MNYDISPTWKTALVVAAFWELIWKGLALWRAGRKNQPGWFVVLLLINSLGVLPILYLLTHKNSDDESARRHA